MTLDEIRTTPVEELEGVDLCIAVALVMGWGRSSNGSRWCDLDRCERIIPKDATFKMASNDDRAEVFFRPDLDWNHLREVVDEIINREWQYRMGVCEVFQDTGDCVEYQGEGDSEAEALLRAFVAAARAESNKEGEKP